MTGLPHRYVIGHLFVRQSPRTPSVGAGNRIGCSYGAVGCCPRSIASSGAIAGEGHCRSDGRRGSCRVHVLGAGVRQPSSEAGSWLRRWSLLSARMTLSISQAILQPKWFGAGQNADFRVADEGEADAWSSDPDEVRSEPKASISARRVENASSGVIGPFRSFGGATGAFARVAEEALWIGAVSVRGRNTEASRQKYRGRRSSQSLLQHLSSLHG